MVSPSFRFESARWDLNLVWITVIRGMVLLRNNLDFSPPPSKDRGSVGSVETFRKLERFLAGFQADLWYGCWTKNRGKNPQNGWFIRENPIKTDDLGCFTFIFGNTHMCFATLFPILLRSCVLWWGFIWWSPGKLVLSWRWQWMLSYCVPWLKATVAKDVPCSEFQRFHHEKHQLRNYTQLGNATSLQWVQILPRKKCIESRLRNLS